MPTIDSPALVARARTTIAFAILLVVTGCSAATTPVPTPEATASPNPTATASSPATPVPSGSPTATATATTAPTPTSSPTAACQTSVAADKAPTDRLTGMTVESGLAGDTITFTFGRASGQPSGTTPTGELKPVQPPFTKGESGLPVTIAGDRFFAVTFRGMAVADEQGNATYSGPGDVKPTALHVREVYLSEAFEGVVNFIVGVSGDGCVTVTRLGAPDRIVVTVVR